MSNISNDNKKSCNLETNSLENDYQQINSDKSDIKLHSQNKKAKKSGNSILNTDDSNYEIEVNSNVLEKTIKSHESSDQENDKSNIQQSAVARKQVRKPSANCNKNPNPRNHKISNENESEKNEDYNLQKIKNNKANQEIGNLRKSESTIKTMDSERPPSGYSSYSYYYDYSESEDEEKNYRTQEVRKARKKKKNKKDFPKYVRPLIDIPQDEMSILKKKALNLQPLEDLNDDVYEALIYSLAEDRKNFAKSEDLEQSERLNLAINHVTECQLEQRKYVLQQEAYSKYKDQMVTVQNELLIFDEKTAELEAKLRANLNVQRCSLQEQHERQIEILQSQWNSKEKQKQYNHASPRLLFLRKQYQQLMQQCRFKEATEVKTQIAQFELKEGNEAIKLMQHNFDENMNQILKKQAEELQFFDARASIQIKKFKQEREKLRIPIENKEVKLKNMEDNINNPEKLWNRSQMKRTTEISQGKIRDAKVSSKLTAKDLGQKNDTTIKLPKLKLRRKVTKSAF